MYTYVLTGIEKNENGQCPLYEKAFPNPNDAKIYAHERFYLRGWQETKKYHWQIVTADRIYKIDRRRIKRNDS